jgi:lysyl-tRNA synthetase class II
MEITKHNIRQVIEDYLKSERIKYTTEGENSKGLMYEIYVGSLECYLQVEYNLDDDNDNDIVVQLFTKVDSYGDSLYHVDWLNWKEGDSIETEIESLIQQTKKINSLVNKVRNKIEQIKEICEENELDIEEFITINYDFDD